MAHLFARTYQLHKFCCQNCFSFSQNQKQISDKTIARKRTKRTNPGHRKSSHGITEQGIGDKGKCRRTDAYLTARRDSNGGSNVVEIRGRMETKADGEVQSKDLASAAAASTDDCSRCCCIQRMTVSGVQKARTICNRRS